MKRVLLLFVALTSVTVLTAGPVTRQQAQSVAQGYLFGKGRSLSATKPAFRSPRRNLSASVPTEDQAYFYVFNADGGQGYVIVSGDDRTEKILGYCDEGSFYIDEQSENVRNFLQSYADKIKYLDDIGYEGPQGNTSGPAVLRGGTLTRHAASLHDATGSGVYRAVAPLLKSKWNQGFPYNLKCPNFFNADGTMNEGRCPTGCVATAAAQVMYYYKWPKQLKSGIPALTTTFSTDAGEKKVVSPRVPKGTVIDWDHMYDTYGTRPLSKEDSTAISDFNLWVGQAYRMAYGPGGSGSSTTGHIKELINIFDYDDGTHAESRGYYSVAEWTDMLYEEISTGHPIPYGGQSMGGGHSFVIDGYDGEGLFHVNWGWGSGGGYYRIDVLSPGQDAGIGASTTADGYAMLQACVMGMRIPDDVPVEAPQYRLATFPNQANNFNINDQTKVLHVAYCNWSGTTGLFYTNAATVEEDGSLKAISNTGEKNYGTNAVGVFDFSLASLGPGTHKVVPVSRFSNSKIWKTDFNNKICYFEVNVDEDGSMTHVWHPIDKLEVTSMEVNSSRAVDQTQDVTVSYKNDGEEYFRCVGLFASQTDEMGEPVNFSQLLLKSGQTTTVVYNFKPNATGTWHLWLADKDDRSHVYAEMDIEINSYGTTLPNPCNLECPSPVGVTNKVGSNIIGTTSYCRVAVKNNGTQDYDGTIFIQRWRKHTSDTSNVIWTNGGAGTTVHIPAGETQMISCKIGNLEPDHYYYFSVNYSYGSRSIRIRGADYSGTMGSGSVVYNIDGSVSGISSASSSYSANQNVAAIDFSDVSVYPRLTLARANQNVVFAFAGDATVPESLDGRNVIVGDKADEITITDGTTFFTPCFFTAKHISYSRTFDTALDAEGKTGWQTIVLPFAPTRISVDGEPLSWKDGDFRLLTFARTTADEDVCFEQPDEWDADIPYVIGVPESLLGKTIVFEADDAPVNSSIDNIMSMNSDFHIFTGTNVKQTLTNVYVLNAEGSAFELAEEATVDPFRAYFVERLGMERKVVIAPDGTGISLIPALPRSEGERAVYDLQGRKVADSPSSLSGNSWYSSKKGVYIVNGKKVVIK